MTSRREVSARQLAWLREELEAWQAAGLVDDATAADIGDRYVVSRRLSLERLAFLLGAGFVGVGLLWLIAANLEHLSPLVRFVGISVVWLGSVAAAEVLAGRRRESGLDRESPLVAAVRLLVVLTYGGVVFQAAQSLQVPAYDPTLLGVWGLGALGYAYASAGMTALLVGIATSVGWYVWVVGERAGSGAVAAVALLVGAGVAVSAAVAHGRRWRPRFAAPWTLTGALLALIGLFIAALPGVTAEPTDLPAARWIGVAVAVAAGAGAFVLTDGLGRFQVVAVAGMLVATLVLLTWSPGRADGLAGGDVVTGVDLVHALVATAVYVAAAAWFAAVGVLRESQLLVFLAAAALVVFVMVQSFAVFEPLLSGAALFLALGAVLLATGVVVQQGRRRLLSRMSRAAA